MTSSVEDLTSAMQDIADNVRDDDTVTKITVV